MSTKLTQIEIDALLALMTCRGEITNPDLDKRYGFRITGKLRTALEKGGYIVAHPHGQTFLLELTEEGWRRCREEFASEVDPDDRRSTRIHCGVMHVWDSYLTRNRLQLADLLPDADPDQPLSAGLLFDVYSQLTPKIGAWVGLASLRGELPGFSKTEVDELLLRLFLERDIQLIPEENQKSLTHADHKAAIRIGREDRHLVAMEHRL